MINEYDGKVVCGISSASGEGKKWEGCGSIECQMKWIKRHYPSIAVLFENIKMATINLELDRDVDIHNWDYYFDKVDWLPHSNTWFEIIAFKKCEISIASQTHLAWIYKAFRSPHRNQKNFLEIIAHQIDSIHPGVACHISFDD